MIFPQDLLLTQEQFIDIVCEHEQKFLIRNENERSPIVQIWINLNSKLVRDKYIEDLKSSYQAVGWNNVEVKFIEDRGEKLYIYLEL
jgi:hypothetical protein